MIPLKVGELVIAWLDDEAGKQLERLATKQPCSAGPAPLHLTLEGPRRTYELGRDESLRLRYMESSEPIRATIELKFLNASQWQEDTRCRR